MEGEYIHVLEKLIFIFKINKGCNLDVVNQYLWLNTNWNCFHVTKFIFPHELKKNAKNDQLF